jgi:hypothetical protein
MIKNVRKKHGSLRTRTIGIEIAWQREIRTSYFRRVDMIANFFRSKMQF